MRNNVDRWLILLVLMTGWCGLLADPLWSQDSRNKVWVFLVTGKPTDGIPKEEIAKKQTAHLANFKRLAEEKLLFAAGPMIDPMKPPVLRGIVVVAANDQNRLEDLFSPDPYVSEGFMKTEGNAIAEMDGEMTPDLNATNLEEYRIVVWNRSNGPSNSSLKPNSSLKNEDRASSPRPVALQAHNRYWKEMREAGKVACRARFTEDAPRFGVVLLPAIGDDTLTQWLKADPMVQHGFIDYQIMPQYLMKGTVKLK